MRALTRQLGSFACLYAEDFRGSVGLRTCEKASKKTRLDFRRKSCHLRSKFEGWCWQER